MAVKTTMTVAKTTTTTAKTTTTTAKTTMTTAKAKKYCGCWKQVPDTRVGP